MHLNKAPLQAGSRWILSTGSFISLIANLQLTEDRLSTSKTGTACGLVLRVHRAWSPARPPSHTHGQPCSPVLLWQTSLGGTVRQCSCPCQGKQYPLLSPPLPIFRSCAGFSRMLLQAAAASRSDIPFLTATHSETALAPQGNKIWGLAKIPERIFSPGY